MENRFVQCIQYVNKNVNIKDTIFAIKNAGFDGVFIQWYDLDWDFSQQQQVDLCRELGLAIDFFHLGHKDIVNRIWEEDKRGEELVEIYKRNLQDCKKNNVDTAVIHLTSGSTPPPPSEIGIKRWVKIVAEAEKLNIKLAFENVETCKHLDYLFNNINSDNIGLCFDSGHYHFFSKDFDMRLFKDKVFAVHLHDNDTTGDLHLLPFDGTINWENILQILKEANYNGPVSLESCYRYDYLKNNLNDFYKNSYTIALKLKEIDKKLDTK